MTERIVDKPLERSNKLAIARTNLARTRGKEFIDARRDRVLLKAVEQRFSACADCAFFEINNGNKGTSLNCAKRQNIYLIYIDPTYLGRTPECDLKENLVSNVE